MPLGRATVAESCNLAINTSQIILKNGTEDTYLHDQGKFLSEKGEQMKVSLATNRTKETSEALANLDDIRDSQISALKYFLRGHMAWDHRGQKQLAARIFNVLKKHGLGLAYENYEEESALLESLLAELKLPENKEAVDSLDLSKLIEDLNKSQTEFSELYRKSAEIEASKEDVVAATKIKQEVRAKLIEIANYLNALTVANPERYKTVSAEIAELVNNLNQKIRARDNN